MSAISALGCNFAQWLVARDEFVWDVPSTRPRRGVVGISLRFLVASVDAEDDVGRRRVSIACRVELCHQAFKRVDVLYGTVTWCPGQAVKEVSDCPFAHDGRSMLPSPNHVALQVGSAAETSKYNRVKTLEPRGPGT